MSGTGDRVAKAFSCIRCFERKVKCDKQNPCANCIKSNVECIFRIPPAPRRKKKRPQDELLLARLKKCEDLLKSKGIDIDSPQSPTMSTAASTDTPVSIPQPGSGFFASPEGDKSGQLLVDHGRSRFIENNLWTSVSNEVMHTPYLPRSTSFLAARLIFPVPTQRSHCGIFRRGRRH